MDGTNLCVLSAIPVAFDIYQEPHRMRSGSVKSVTFDEKLTYYGESSSVGNSGGGGGRVEGGRPEEGTFEYHIYDEVKYPPTLSDQKNI